MPSWRRAQNDKKHATGTQRGRQEHAFPVMQPVSRGSSRSRNKVDGIRYSANDLQNANGGIERALRASRSRKISAVNRVVAGWRGTDGHRYLSHARSPAGQANRESGEQP